MAESPEAPPRAARWLILRAALAAVLVVLMTGTAVAAVVLRELDDTTCEFFACDAEPGSQPDNGLEIPEVDRASAGEPRTLLVLGSDERYGDRVRGRSDTILIVRVDPDADAITVMSVPRDLKVTIPGHGRDKVNAAYAEGGERLAVRTLKRLFSRPGEPFEITNVVNVNFGGFRRAVDYIGGVYIDVDRTYDNDNQPPTDSPVPYAVIDVASGYRKLEGQEALDYVRYRHTDNDLVRAARQQDFLRQLKSQPGARKLLQLSERKRLARIFRRYIKVDTSLRDSQQILSFLKLAVFTRNKPVLQVPFRASESGEYLAASDRQIDATLEDFLEPKVAGQTKRAETKRAAPSAKSRKRTTRRKAASVPSGLVRDRRTPEDMAIVASARAGFPFYFPTLRADGARYSDAPAPGSSPPVPRLYRIRDQDGKLQRAYRIVVTQNRVLGQYYGIQGTTWRDPPILANPSETRTVRGRKLQLYYDGRDLRMVAWQTSKGSYWVSNTLTNTLSNPEMLAIASSLTRLKG